MKKRTSFPTELVTDLPERIRVTGENWESSTSQFSSVLFLSRTSDCSPGSSRRPLSCTYIPTVHSVCTVQAYTYICKKDTSRFTYLLFALSYYKVVKSNRRASRYRQILPTVLLKRLIILTAIPECLRLLRFTKTRQITFITLHIKYVHV